MGFLDKLRREAKKKNPGTLVIFSYPKVGKTEAYTQLPEPYMIVDFDESSEFYSGNFYDVKTLDDLNKLIKILKEENIHFKVIVLDTITSMYDKIVNELAVILYNKDKGYDKPLNWDITTLEYGLGYTYKRNAFKKIIEMFKEFADTVILSGHVADKSLTNATGQADIKEIDIEGKLKNILALKVDAIGLLYRADENTNILSFKNGGGIIAGSRAKHLRGKEIVLSELDEDGNLKTYWDKIFI